MAIYNLDETPDVFVCPAFYDDKFICRMESFNGEEERTIIRTIDFRSDKLIIYGVEIKESMLDKFYDSLILRPKRGVILVNCDGACYILISGKCYRPIHNVIFDWSPFGIIVPNSANDSLRKENEELKKQLSTCELELQKSSDREVKLQKDYSACMEEKEKQKMEWEKLARHQLPKVESELRTTITELELSKKMIIELEEQLSTDKREIQNRDDQLAIINSKLENTKSLFELSNKNSKELEDQILICNKEKQNMETKLQKMEEELSLTKHDLEFTKNKWESLAKSTNEKLDQVLNSMLWMGSQFSQTIGSQGTRCEDAILAFKELDTSIYTLPITQELPADSINNLPISATSEEDIHQGQLSNGIEDE